MKKDIIHATNCFKLLGLIIIVTQLNVIKALTFGSGELKWLLIITKNEVIECIIYSFLIFVFGFAFWYIYENISRGKKWK